MSSVVTLSPVIQLGDGIALWLLRSAAFLGLVDGGRLRVGHVEVAAVVVPRNTRVVGLSIHTRTLWRHSPSIDRRRLDRLKAHSKVSLLSGSTAMLVVGPFVFTLPDDGFVLKPSQLYISLMLSQSHFELFNGIFAFHDLASHGGSLHLFLSVHVHSLFELLLQNLLPVTADLGHLTDFFVHLLYLLLISLV